jgi:hypothetical protein
VNRRYDIHDKGLIHALEGDYSSLLPVTRKYCPYGLSCGAPSPKFDLLNLTPSILLVMVV